MLSPSSKNKLALIGIIGLTLAVIFLWGITRETTVPAPNSRPAALGNRVSIKNLVLEIELADTPTKRGQGLSGRISLAPNQGLLFVFERETKPGFWMKEMNFAIDILWISADKRLVAITNRASPASYPTIFTPPTPVKYVLEINAGLAEQFGLAPGDQVNF